MNQDKCDLYCVNTSKEVVADVLERSDKRIKAVVPGTNATVILTRKDTRRPFTGWLAGMEFETFGDVE